MSKSATSLYLMPATVLALAITSGCAYVPHKSVIDNEPTLEYAEPAPREANGSIFQSASGFHPLFDDRRPRHVGDTLTVVLDEQVSASKSSASNANRTGSAGLSPTLVPDEIDKLRELGFNLDSESTFQGGGGSNASNTFTGTITVTVIKVLPNGNLQVKGEKQIGINQGREYIRFAGIVNPRNISGQNTVPSTQIAEARIEYVGDGYINEAQHMGWLQRLLLNLSPF